MNNISAKSSSIFMKLLGNLHVSIKRQFNKKKQMSKQTNILYQQYPSQIKSNIFKTFRKYSSWYPQMIQAKKTKKQTKKQTNKQTFLDQQYPSQIKFNIYETFSKSSWVYPEKIQMR